MVVMLALMLDMGQCMVEHMQAMVATVAMVKLTEAIPTASMDPMDSSDMPPLTSQLTATRSKQ